MTVVFESIDELHLNGHQPGWRHSRLTARAIRPLHRRADRSHRPRRRQRARTRRLPRLRHLGRRRTPSPSTSGTSSSASRKKPPSSASSTSRAASPICAASSTTISTGGWKTPSTPSWPPAAPRCWSFCVRVLATCHLRDDVDSHRPPMSGPVWFATPEAIDFALGRKDFSGTAIPALMHTNGNPSATSGARRSGTPTIKSFSNVRRSGSTAITCSVPRPVTPTGRGNRVWPPRRATPSSSSVPSSSVSRPRAKRSPG